MMMMFDYVWKTLWMIMMIMMMMMTMMMMMMILVQSQDFAC
jgi:hypothetical protein